MDNLIAFRVGFRQLCLSKNVEYDDDRMDIYYKNLKNLEYILDVLDNSVAKPYRRTQSFPLIEDLIDDHREICEKKRQENADKFGLPEGSFTPMSKSKFRDRHKKFMQFMRQSPTGKNPFWYAHERLEAEANDALKT